MFNCCLNYSSKTILFTIATVRNRKIVNPIVFKTKNNEFELLKKLWIDTVRNPKDISKDTIFPFLVYKIITSL